MKIGQNRCFSSKENPLSLRFLKSVVDNALFGWIKSMEQKELN